MDTRDFVGGSRYTKKIEAFSRLNATSALVSCRFLRNSVITVSGASAHKAWRFASTSGCQEKCPLRI